MSWKITWKDGDNRVLKVDNVANGSTPSYVGDTPEKTETDTKLYFFDGTWSPSITTATSDKTYKANFTSKQKFFFKIDGVNIAPYIKQKGLKYSRNDIDSANAGRTLAGKMNRGRVTSKVKIEISLIPLTQEQAQMILKLIYPEYVTVNYIDPRVGERNVQFYSNNVPTTFNSQATDGSLLWDELSFPLVER